MAALEVALFTSTAPAWLLRVTEALPVTVGQSVVSYSGIVREQCAGIMKIGFSRFFSDFCHRFRDPAVYSFRQSHSIACR